MQALGGMQLCIADEQGRGYCPAKPPSPESRDTWVLYWGGIESVLTSLKDGHAFTQHIVRCGFDAVSLGITLAFSSMA